MPLIAKTLSESELHILIEIIKGVIAAIVFIVVLKKRKKKKEEDEKAHKQIDELYKDKKIQ